MPSNLDSVNFSNFMALASKRMKNGAQGDDHDGMLRSRVAKSEDEAALIHDEAEKSEISKSRNISCAQRRAARARLRRSKSPAAMNKSARRERE